MADEQILVAGTSALPLSYGVPNSVEEALLCVNATIDGTNASGNYLATVEIVSDGGVVVARCPCFTTIAAGASAEVSWFRIREQTLTAPSATAYETLILTTGGLVLYLKLDELAGTTLIDTKQGNNGVYVGGPTLGVPPLADGTAVVFNGSSTYGGNVAAPPYSAVPGLQANGEMSIEFWFKTTMNPGIGVNPQIVNMDTVSPGGRYFRARHNGTTNAITYDIFGTDETGHGLDGVTVINDGVRHYCACTFDGTTMKVYIDGNLDASVNPAMGGFPLNNVNRGYWVGTGAPTGGGTFAAPHWAGTLDEVGLYNIALTAAQISAHNTAGRIVP